MDRHPGGASGDLGARAQTRQNLPYGGIIQIVNTSKGHMRRYLARQPATRSRMRLIASIPINSIILSEGAF